ncbi:MAG: methyltransferase domain-containing protein [Verrucomicrobiota bacterium]
MTRTAASKPTARPGKITWDAAAYAANSAAQLSWARELIARMRLGGGEHLLDVGCGDGKITAEVARSVPEGSVTGIDASPQMIAFAEQTFPQKRFPNLRFQVTDARAVDFRPRFDVVFSNAALHWVDDHPAFLRGAAAALKPGGRLFVSCGGKGNAHDVFLALRPEMRLARWREFFRRMPMPYFFFAPSDYEKWLAKAGFKITRLELSPKDSTYEGAEGFATWLRTTWLPFTQRVPEPLREEFIAAVTRRYVAKHPPDADGLIHVRMVRLEIEAGKI